MLSHDLLDKHALAFDLFAQCVGNVDVKTGGLAVGGLEGERLVGRVDRHLEVFALGKCIEAQSADGCGKQEFLHKQLSRDVGTCPAGLRKIQTLILRSGIDRTGVGLHQEPTSY
jgi:hypothetical protein